MVRKARSREAACDVQFNLAHFLVHAFDVFECAAIVDLRKFYDILKYFIVSIRLFYDLVYVNLGVVRPVVFEVLMVDNARRLGNNRSDFF